MLIKYNYNTLKCGKLKFASCFYLLIKCCLFAHASHLLLSNCFVALAFGIKVRLCMYSYCNKYSIM